MKIDALSRRINKLQEEMAQLYARGNMQRAVCVSRDLDILIVRAMVKRNLDEADEMMDVAVG